MEHASDPEAVGTTSKNPAELALELYNVLLPYPSDVRLRAIQSAMTSLGEIMVPQRQGAAAGLSGSGDGAEEFGDLNFGPRALKWTQKYGVTRAMLDEIFHLTDDRVDVTASNVPVGSRREMTVNCYLLSGLRGLLKGDVPSFTESEAVAVCKRLTAYDKNNHTANRNSVGNKMSGTKPTFTLTGPGETAAAELVKQMTISRKT
jgi:hypothetical protein